MSLCQALPALSIQEVSEALLRDGVSVAGVPRFAALGAHGDQKQNVSRDFFRMVKKLGFHGEVEISHEVMYVHLPGEPHPQEWQFPLIMPHDILNAFWRANSTKFQNNFFPEGDSSLNEFWRRSASAPWFAQHCFRDTALQWPSMCIPYRLHGDEAPFSKTGSKSLFVLNFSAVLSKAPSMLSRFLIWAVVCGSVLNFDGAVRALEWSLRLLGEGIMPMKDWHGRDFPCGSTRHRERGKPICGGYRFLLTQLCGDLKWLKETMDFPHFWGSPDAMCWMCHAVKDASNPLCGYNFASSAPWRSAPRTHESYMRCTGHGVSWCRLPGFHKSMVQLDLMHILFLGALQWELASALYELLESRHWPLPPGVAPGRWQYSWAFMLSMAYTDFVAWCRLHKLVCSHPTFTLAQLGLTSLRARPFLKCKAGNCWKIGMWLCAVWSKRAQEIPSVHNQAVFGCLYGFIQTAELCKSCDVWLTDDVVDQLKFCRDLALCSHAFLANEAHLTRRAHLWVTKPKHHLYDECISVSVQSRLSPGNHWVFADEDFIGRCVSITKFVWGGPKRAERTLLRYLLRVHCLLQDWRATIPDADF